VCHELWLRSQCFLEVQDLLDPGSAPDVRVLFPHLRLVHPFSSLLLGQAAVPGKQQPETRERRARLADNFLLFRLLHLVH